MIIKNMIRRYIPQDKESLMKLLSLHIPQYFAPSEAGDFEEYLENHLEDYFVLEEANQIVGAGGINYFLETKSARISWDLVHPDFQGKGLGKELTLYRINHLKQNKDIEEVIVRTSQLVYHFYEKCGFVLQKTEKDFWAEGFDLYQMKLESL
jgi:N-acetylglutamate synthase-like GNAT family acetyltransferase